MELCTGGFIGEWSVGREDGVGWAGMGPRASIILGNILGSEPVPRDGLSVRVLIKRPG